MKGKAGVRIAFAILVLLLFGFYMYAHVSAGPFSEDAGTFHLREQNKQSEPAPAEPELPIETPEPTPTPTPTPTIDPNSPEGKAAALGLPKPPDIDINSWEFLMANPDHNISEYEPPLVEYSTASLPDNIRSNQGMKFDERIVEPMTEFITAAGESGVQVFLSSGYRPYSEQAYLFREKVKSVGSEAAAASIVAVPGTSEHQTGLACDITDHYRHPKIPEELEITETYKWLYEHCQDYGFILRYPKDKVDITKVMYEPWHFRYVGVEAATYMMENNLCYEEFYALYTDE